MKVNIFTRMATTTISLVMIFMGLIAINNGDPSVTLALSEGDSSQVVQTQDDAGVTILLSDSQQFSFDVDVPQVEREVVTIANESVEKIAIDGFEYLDIAGQPNVPQRGFLVALPPGATASVSVVDMDSVTLNDIVVAPKAWQELVDYNIEQREGAPTFEEQVSFDQSVYGQDELFPASSVVLSEEMWLRDQRVVSVMVRPVQVNSVARTALVHTNLQIQVQFDYPNGQPAGSPRPESAPFENVLANNVLNYDVAQNWRQAPPAGFPPQTAPCMDNNAFRITIEETGMYQITHAELAALGFPASTTASQVRMCYGADEIAIRLEDNNSNNNFDNGDAVVFYGEAIKTQETTTNVYWLTYGGGVIGDRMMTVDGTPAGGTVASSYQYTNHIEEDNQYYGLFPMSDDTDHWYWGQIGYNSAAPTTATFNFNIANIAGGTYQVPVTAEVRGHVNNDPHAYNVLVNGNVIGSGTFSGSGRSAVDVFSGTVSSSQLNAGANTVSIEATDSGVPLHFMVINWVEIGPRRQFVAQNNRLAFEQPTAGTWRYNVSGLSGTVQVFDVTDNVAPQHIINNSGGSFQQTIAGAAQYELVTTSSRRSVTSIVKDSLPTPLLQDVSNEADYIIITDPTLASALTPLVALRNNQGLSVKIVYVQDIFDEFSYGLYAPEAIENFLTHAYNEWPNTPGEEPPTYVLLAGNGSYDHRNLLGNNDGGYNTVPVYLRSGIDTNIGETASDNQYVAIVGNDDLADMLLGRLPAATTAEMTTMVSRIVTYETSGFTGGWQSDHLFVADNGYKPPAPCTPDPAGDFFATVNTFIATHFPVESQIATRLYYAPTDCYPNAQYPVYEDYYVPTAMQMTTSIIEELNQGKHFVVYTGHSAIGFWAGENFFNTTNITQGSLVNGDRTPIMLPMTCLEGSYHYPGTESVSVELLKLAGGGAVASYAPTGLQVQAGHDYLLNGFYDAVFDNDTIILGEAVYGAKLYLATNTSAFQDLQDTFMLLGDPAMQMNIWEFSDRIFLPTTLRN